jgi:transcriptional regulator with XRE-family HTH domain
MAPPRKRDTSLGHHLRAAREHRGLGQTALARLVHVSPRQVSRWENGRWPNADEAERLINIFAEVPASLYNALATALGFELVDDDAPTIASVPAVVAHPQAPPPAPSPPPPAPSPLPAPVALPRARDLSDPTLRKALDAVLLAASEARDVLPRHLRAFGVALLAEVARLGLAPGEAAALLGARLPDDE